MPALLFFLFLLMLPISLQAEIAVIGNLESTVKSLTKQEVQAIFMGRSRVLENGNFVLPLDFSELRSEFYYKLTNRPIEQINAYWARIMFSGQASPPLSLTDELSIIHTVTENKSTISYLDLKHVDHRQVRVLLILD